MSTNLVFIIILIVTLSMDSLTMTIDDDCIHNNNNNVLSFGHKNNKRETKLTHRNGLSKHYPSQVESNKTNNRLHFTQEPPNQVTFFNTEGTIVECWANSSESVKITWTTIQGQRVSDVTGLRYIRDDGLLVFPPFSPNDYKQSIHFNQYICIVTDKYGSIASRLVTVKGVIRRSLTIHVHDQHIEPGGTTAFTCHISGSEWSNQLMMITSWLEEPSGRIITTIASKSLTIGTLLSSKYIALDDGRLYINSVSTSLNNNRYRCRVICKLTGEVLTSSSAGRLIVTATREPFAPKITVKSDLIIGEFGSQVVVTCIASGYPLPSYKWIPRYSMIKQHSLQHLMMLTGDNGSNQNNQSLQSVNYLKMNSDTSQSDQRYIQVNQFLVIKNLTQPDMGTIGCWVNNSLGQDKVSIQLMVRSPLRVNLSIISDYERDSQVTLINCDYIGYPVTSIEWRLNGQPLSSLYSFNGSSTIKLLTATRLKIERITEKEQGYYQCFISNEYESVHGIVQLQKPIITLQFLETFSSIILSEGDSLQLLCKVTGYPTPRITWTLDHQAISSSVNKREITTQLDSKENVVVSLLKVESIILLDAGLYGCVAENSGKKIVHSNRVHVRGLPFVKSLLNRITIAGSQLTVHCPVVGFPIDRLLWIKDGQVLPFNSNQNVNSDGSLEIRNQSKAQDQGKYTCRAFQGNYSSESTFLLAIKVKPVIESFRFPGGLHKGQRASISCTVATGDYPMVITWSNDGSIIPNDSSDPKVISVSDYSSSLLFESLDVTHRGNYTCRSTNDAGFAEHSAYLEINEAPLWTLEPVDSWTIRGNKVIIHCQANGYPIPRIRWSKSVDQSGKEFKPIASNPHMQVHENGSLIIHETISSDAGYYLCQAHNSVGPGLSKVVNLNVYVKAHFTEHNLHNHSKIGENTILTCIAHGDDPLDMQWSKDGQTIAWNYIGTLNHQHQSSGLKSFSHYKLFEEHLPNLIRSKLHISSSKSSDNGLFKCRSSNSFGSDELTIKLTIQEPPSQPINLTVDKISSRWITVSWRTQFNGHSPITNHLIQYTESWSIPESTLMDQLKVMVVMGETMNAKVTGLRPGQRYTLVVIAENAIGRSNSSNSIQLTTEEEPASSSPLSLSLSPLSSTSIRVTWEPPEVKDRNGQILGYFIGIKVANEIALPYTYYTYNVSDESESAINDEQNVEKRFPSEKTFSHSTSQRLSIILDNLKQLTKYSIIVHSFNSKGSSPATSEKQVTTFGIDLPSTPSPSIVYISSTSIHLTWTQVIDDSHPIQGYHIYHRISSSPLTNRHHSMETDKWSQITLIGHQTFYTFQGLECATLYHFYLVAYNSMGLSSPSDIMEAKTNGSLPIIPDYSEAIYQNSSSIYVSLEAWRSSGCPIEDFIIKYQINSGSVSRWNQLEIPSQFKWKGLVSIEHAIGSINKIQISVHNKLGITKVEYIFSPLSSPLSFPLTVSSSTSLSSMSSSKTSNSSGISRLNVNFESNKRPSSTKLTSKVTNKLTYGFNETLISQVIYYAAWGSVIWLVVLLIYFASKSTIWSNRDNNGSNRKTDKSVESEAVASRVVFENTNSANINLTSNEHAIDDGSNCMTMKVHDKCFEPEALVTMVKMTTNGTHEPLYSTIMKKSQCKL